MEDTTMLNVTIVIPAGGKLFLEDQIWEFEEPTTIIIENPPVNTLKERDPWHG